MYRDVYQEWLDSDILAGFEKAELRAVADDDDEIEYRFGKDLEFGTAGMRGIIGLGTNMMNLYTVKRATQGLCEYIKALGKKAIKRGVAISYDTRKMSYEFAKIAAYTLSSNGIKAYLFDKVHPVPMLSFAVRKLHCIAGIMITASHNPKEYNGYKVYGEDGAQMSPEATAEVVKYINDIKSPLFEGVLFKDGVKRRVKEIGKKVDVAYYKRIKKLILSPKEIKAVGKTIKPVYTPVHGSGYIPVTTVLHELGIDPYIVKEQIDPDSEFSTVNVPNPEYKETLSMGISLAEEKKADMVFGTDPDCDRLGVAVRDDKGEFVVLSGNETGILLTDYILSRLKEKKKLNKKGFLVKSFVTTGLVKKIADDYGVELFDVPVGFKYIGEKIKQYDDTGKKKFIFAFEESCGYLRGTHARDKDAVVASMLFAEMFCYYSYHGISVYEKLNEIYKKFGYAFDTAVSKNYSGISAMAEMNAAVDKMRTTDVWEIAGENILARRDYKTLERKTPDGKTESVNCSETNALYYELSNGSFICLRPSGTEPKLKVYYSVTGESKEAAEERFNKLKAGFETLLN